MSQVQPKSLVIGASGFLGSHVVKQLVRDGESVRVLVRESSDTRAMDGLELERHCGSPFDADVLRRALQGVEVVYYCVVDTRSWLRDATPLWDTNVHQLPKVLDVAAEFPLKAFVYTSSLLSIGIKPDGVVNETDEFNWEDLAPEYVLTRVAGERCALDHARRSGLPVMVCNVANTFGPGDFAPTPHGKMLWDAAIGRLPFYFEGGLICVGIEDAARAPILAAQRGRAGERYIIGEKFLSMKEMFAIAAGAAGRTPRHFRMPMPVAYTMASTLEWITAIFRKDNRMAVSSLRLLTLIRSQDNSKARQELGWQPQPSEQALREAVAFYLGLHS